jgi:hypothetical protein
LLNKGLNLFSSTVSDKWHHFIDIEIMLNEKQPPYQKFLRLIARATVLVAAIGSLFLMFNAGRNQKSTVLLLLFTVWVLSPFIGFLVIDRISGVWRNSARLSLYWIIILLSIGALIAYSGILIPQQTKNAFIFLVAPFVSWILIAFFFLVFYKSGR